MLDATMDYVPIGLPFYLAFWFLFAVLVAMIEIGVLQYVFQSMGVSRRYMFALLVFSLLGSYVNIPVARLAPEPVRAGQLVDYFGMQYVVPVIVHSPGTVVAVNLGGAVVPFLLSIYLIAKHGLFLQGAAAVAIVAGVVHLMAHPVPGVGIAVPIFIPPLITAFVALSLSRDRAAPLAYVAGSLGTLIGADLLNLDKVRGIGAPVASIGGAGKFDGIFLTGIVAMLIAGILGPRQRARVRTSD
jgi:uncharacterized membrane protein